MRIFVVSIPKSGTYLLREILERMGFAASHRHISERGTYDYASISRQEGRSNPQKCLQRMPLKQSLQQVPEGSFAVGHLDFRHYEALQEFEVIYLYRDLADTVLSYMIYVMETGRAWRSKADQVWLRETDPQQRFLRYIELRGARIIRTARGIQPWADVADVCIGFDDLKKDTTIAVLAEHFGIDVDFEYVRGAYDVVTQTLSADQDRERYWSEQAREWLANLIAS